MEINCPSQEKDLLLLEVMYLLFSFFSIILKIIANTFMAGDQDQEMKDVGKEKEK